MELSHTAPGSLLTAPSQLSSNFLLFGCNKASFIHETGFAQGLGQESELQPCFNTCLDTFTQRNPYTPDYGDRRLDTELLQQTPRWGQKGQDLCPLLMAPRSIPRARLV